MSAYIIGGKDTTMNISRRRGVDNIKTDLGDTEWGGVDSIGLAQDRDQCMFHKLLGISRVTAQLLASQYGLSCMKLCRLSTPSR
jgi:hypothetical protein